MWIGSSHIPLIRVVFANLCFSYEFRLFIHTLEITKSTWNLYFIISRNSYSHPAVQFQVVLLIYLIKEPFQVSFKRVLLELFIKKDQPSVFQH